LRCGSGARSVGADRENRLPDPTPRSRPSIQRPLARHRVMLSRRVVAYYGLIRPSESLPTTYEFAAEAAAPKDIGLGWESRGSPIYSAGLCSRAASNTPVTPKSVRGCSFLFGISLHHPVTDSATTLVVSRLQSSFRAQLVLLLRPASLLALLSRTFTFELSLAGSPRASVEYDYVGKQSIPTTGLSPASPTALWAAEPGPTLRSHPVFGAITSGKSECETSCNSACTMIPSIH
jgi:hypothetical protein